MIRPLQKCILLITYSCYIQSYIISLQCDKSHFHFLNQAELFYYSGKLPRFIYTCVSYTTSTYKRRYYLRRAYFIALNATTSTIPSFRLNDNSVHLHESSPFWVAIFITFCKENHNVYCLVKTCAFWLAKHWSIFICQRSHIMLTLTYIIVLDN